VKIQHGLNNIYLYHKVTEYTLNTRTVDTSGNINTIWINNTTTTTTASGTPPAAYDLRTNATDNSPNRNSNTTVGISLIILPQETISTYNFSTGPGEDKWAFRKQHKKKPPAVNNVSNIEFNSPRYEKIMADDGTLIIIAQQNSRRWWFGRPSRIGTDYVRMNVTYEPY
jgi:hypothetical protein